MADLTNAAIAQAFDELGDLYELDGADQYRVIAYRNAARSVRDASVSVAELTEQGKATTLPGIGKTLDTKLQALVEEGDMPQSVKLREKFPPGLLAGHAPAGLRAQARPPAARRARHRLAGGAARRRRGGPDRAGCAASARKVEENLIADARRRAASGGPAPRVLLTRALGLAEQIAGALRARRRRRPGRDRRLGAPPRPTPSRTST